MMRQLGSFQLASGSRTTPSPSGPGVWVETDVVIAAPVASDAVLAFREADADVVPFQSDAEVVPYVTDVDVYL
jgi:hypothetical protein